MKPIHVLLLSLAALYVLNGCRGQAVQDAPDTNSNVSQEIGGGCDGCELMYVGIPSELSSTHTNMGWVEGKHKLLVTGRVFQLDGRTPAPNTIIYYWHTDEQGLYSSDQHVPQEALRHGMLRGWVKSDANGNYTIRTSRPAAYPNETIPQHIHLSIKEKNRNEYYADLYFDDDPLYLTHQKKYGKIDRAGTEVLRVLNHGNHEVAEHNIILGLNIPNYPIAITTSLASGLNIGEDQPSFTPFHAFGPDKGTATCPVCKYGRFHGILYFVGAHPQWDEIKQWLRFLEAESIQRQKYLKAYFVYGNANHESQQALQLQLEKIGRELNLQKVALTFVPDFNDRESEVYLNKINPDVSNTFIIYRYRTIIDKFVNLPPTEENYQLISEVLNTTQGESFEWQEPSHH
ncbi:MAG: intradiol ring-cleavage dioxygenase [Cyclobacteriaceae bacterium]|nr:intradiol ring-cleavage dioxygenase [Cyclobacteriaceae bacterium]